MALIVPAVLPATERELVEHLTLLSSLPGVRRIQIDVVDGRLASPPSWPYNSGDQRSDAGNQKEDLLEGLVLPDIPRIEYEIDLMCLDAFEAAGHWLALGASRLTFHIESVAAAPDLLERVKKRYGDSAATFGLAVNLETPLALAERFARGASYLQCMGIAHIGRQGEPLDERVFAQLRALKSSCPSLPLQVDGGVSLASARALRAAGADDLVVGSCIVGAPDPAAAFASFSALP